MADEPEKERRIEETLAFNARTGNTGALEVRDGKRRRVFFLSAGRLLLTHSNLKSETAERVAARSPGAKTKEIPQLQAISRLRSAMHSDAPQVKWHGGSRPPRTETLDLPAILLAAIESTYDSTELLAILNGIHSGNPLSSASTLFPSASLPFSEKTLQWLETLDGLRDLDEVLQFAPDSPTASLLAIYLADLLGLLRWVEPPSISGSGTSIENSQNGGASAPDKERDISRLIAEGLSGPEKNGSQVQDSRVPAPQTEPSAQVPSQGDGPSNADIEAIQHELDRMDSASDYFQLLGVSWDSQVEVFRNAYFTLARKIHPDRLNHADSELREKASKAFDKAREAWDVLKEDESRQAYLDRTIHGKKTEDELAMERVREILDAEETFRRGIAAFNAGRVNEAHTAFKQAYSVDPEHPEFMSYYGFTTWRTQQNRDPEAAEAGYELLRNALDKGKKMDRAWVLLGRIYRDRQERDMAWRCMVHALRINPSNADAQRGLERLKREKEDQKRAEMGFLRRLFHSRKPRKAKEGREKKAGGKID